MSPDDRATLRVKAEAAQALARDLPSPCTSVCRISDERGLCKGCLRTLDEIAAWSRMDDAAKRGVWRTIGLRASQDA